MKWETEEQSGLHQITEVSQRGPAYRHICLSGQHHHIISLADFFLDQVFLLTVNNVRHKKISRSSRLKINTVWHLHCFDYSFHKWNKECAANRLIKCYKTLLIIGTHCTIDNKQYVQQFRSNLANLWRNHSLKTVRKILLEFLPGDSGVIILVTDISQILQWDTN